MIVVLHHLVDRGITSLKGTCLMYVLRRYSGGLKGAAPPLVDREKILVYPLALAKVTVFFGLLSPIIGGQVSSNSLLFGR